MKVELSLVFSLITALWAYDTQAQTTVSTCPLLPKEAENSLQWVALQMPETLLCRAILTDNGTEAFVVTISRNSPFKANSSLRDSEIVINGQKTYWYRSEIASRPNELIRETLVNVTENNVAHIFIRTNDKEDLSRYQMIVQNLTFNASE